MSHRNRFSGQITLALALGIIAGVIGAFAPVALATGALPDAGQDGFDAVKSWARARVRSAETEFRGARHASPGFWGEQIVYSIMIDRFNNGDLSNDRFNLEPAQLRGDLREILRFRHGGDLKGITARLDYLRDLGITTVYITPFLKHTGAYHGYCPTDPTEVDPGFGTKEDVRTLVREAHARGLLVVFDVVMNHLCDGETTYSRAPAHVRCANDLGAKHWSGEPGGSPAQGELAFSSKFFAPLKSPHFFNRCGPNTNGEISSEDPATIFGDFVGGMYDLDTRNHDLQVIFTELYKYWIADTDVDGFRLDAGKHVTEDFLAYFSTSIRDYARRLGKQNFLIVGEVTGPPDWIGRRLGQMYTNPRDPGDHGVVPASLTSRLWEMKPFYEKHSAAPYAGLNAVFDFAYAATGIQVLQNDWSTLALESYFRGEMYNNISAQNDFRLSWNFLETHDWPRFSKRAPAAQDRTQLGVGYLAFSEGTPLLYYGIEQGFNADCHYDSMNIGNARPEIEARCKLRDDALFRQDMFISGYELLGSTVPEINRLAYIGPVRRASPGEDPFLNRGHALYKNSRKFLHVRRSCKALSFGRTTHRWIEPVALEGLLAFSRIDRVGSRVYEALIVMNTSWTDRALPELRVEDPSSGRVWKNLLYAYDQGVTSGRGSLEFGGRRIGANQVMVFVPAENAAPFDPRLETQLCVE